MSLAITIQRWPRGGLRLTNFLSSGLSLGRFPRLTERLTDSFDGYVQNNRSVLIFMLILSLLIFTFLETIASEANAFCTTVKFIPCLKCLKRPTFFCMRLNDNQPSWIL